ncbi:MAG: RNA pyrophosphohydrolase [Alphaproteobacteria bacterium]|nr:RNA pyrophosphohydrolase [Alphaproteobacteria bacterium]
MKQKLPFAMRPYRRGVGVILLSGDGLVFAGQRVDTPEPAWQLPQGGIDEGETPIEAALRELKEETGTDKADVVSESADWFTYDLPPELADKVWHGRYRGQQQKWFVMRFTGDDGDIDISGPSREFARWKWASLDDIAAQIVPFKRDMYIQVLEALRPAILAVK